MNPFATTDQYELRYGAADDLDVLSEALMDATRVICAELDKAGVSYESPSESYADRLMQACRSMAYRAMGPGECEVPLGATQFSEGADGYTQSFTLGNPYGDIFMTKGERKLLGLGGAKVGFASPWGDSDA